MSRLKLFPQKNHDLCAGLLEQEDTLCRLDSLSDEEIRELFTPAQTEARTEPASAAANRSYWSGTVHNFLRNRSAVAMLGVILLLLVFSVIQPYLPGQYHHNFINNDPETGLQLMNCPPNSQFWLGTNNIGQDLWARIWAGTRTSLIIGVSVAAIQCLIGVSAGFVWGYVKRLDPVFSELYNVISNIPSMIILMLATYILRPGILTMIISMCFTGWLGVARFVRNQVMIVRECDFNRASRCLGTPFSRILVKNLLPHTFSVIILQFVLAIPAAIGSEVFLTYIGLGLQAEFPSLGNLVNTGRILIMSPSLRYQFYFPCIILSIITICFYMVGNAFADAADPKNHT